MSDVYQDILGIISQEEMMAFCLTKASIHARLTFFLGNDTSLAVILISSLSHLRSSYLSSTVKYIFAPG
jgi:hypothetical protein